VQLPCKFRVRAAVCCSCCCVACVVSVVARHVRAVVVWLAVDSLAVVFSYGGWLQESPGAVLLVVFGAFECVCVMKAERACVCLVLAGCELWLRCIAWLPCVLCLRCTVGLAGAFWRVFSERCLGGSGGGSPRTYLRSPFVASGGGSSQEYSMFVLGHRCVAPVVRSVSFGWATFWRGSPRTALGTLGWRFSPDLLHGAGGLIHFLASCVLAQMVVWHECCFAVHRSSCLACSCERFSGSRCSVFGALLEADVVVSGEESFSLARGVVSATGALMLHFA
ncbi:hypothetical protein Taro_045040, partial [Colocasia esculenta]|nr:hypothetical protein [Colocasia esculenta]